MSRRQGRVVRLGDAMGGFARRADRGDGLATARVTDVWEEVVGEQVSRHTAGITLRDGQLLVRVDSHAWAAELETMHETLKERVNSVLGETLVRGIRFTVSRMVADERRREEQVISARKGYGGESVTPVPLSAEEREEVARSVASIKSEELREAAIRATVRDLEWKKARQRAKSRDAASHDSTDTTTGLLP